MDHQDQRDQETQNPQHELQEVLARLYFVLVLGCHVETVEFPFSQNAICFELGKFAIYKSPFLEPRYFQIISFNKLTTRRLVCINFIFQEFPATLKQLLHVLC